MLFQAELEEIHNLIRKIAEIFDWSAPEIQKQRVIETVGEWFYTHDITKKTPQGREGDGA